MSLCSAKQDVHIACRVIKLLEAHTVSVAVAELRRDVSRLQRELLDERTKVRALSEELENPMNVHRWRKLEGSDPATYEMIQKIQTLQRRLIAKTEEVVRLATTRTMKIVLSVRRIVVSLSLFQNRSGLPSEPGAVAGLPSSGAISRLRIAANAALKQTRISQQTGIFLVPCCAVPHGENYFLKASFPSASVTPNHAVMPDPAGEHNWRRASYFRCEGETATDNDCCPWNKPGQTPVY